MSLKNFRHTKIEYFHISFGRDLNVGRLQVTMRDSLFVGVRHGIRDLPGNRQRLFQGDGASGDAIGECEVPPPTQARRRGD